VESCGDQSGFSGNKATGISTNANGQHKPIAVDLTGPIFADATGSMVTIGCLPLADGYSTTVRDWDIERLKERLWQLKVTGAERVTVPAGTFDSYKVELTANDGTGDKETAWIAKDSRMPVKIDAVDKTLRHHPHGNGSVTQKINNSTTSTPQGEHDCKKLMLGNEFESPAATGNCNNLQGTGRICSDEIPSKPSYGRIVKQVSPNRYWETPFHHFWATVPTVAVRKKVTSFLPVSR
jgi:hypothetical protein